MDKKQLTAEFGGSIHYRHQEWIEQRQVFKRKKNNNKVLIQFQANKLINLLKSLLKS